MKYAAILLACSLTITTACATRDRADAPVIPPNKIMDFSFLYARNCSGCHGADGKGGAAIGIGDPVYLAIADDATIGRVTANGVAGTHHRTAFCTTLQVECQHLLTTRSKSSSAECDPVGPRPTLCKALWRRPMQRRVLVMRSVEPPYLALTVRRVTARTAAEASELVPS